MSGPRWKGPLGWVVMAVVAVVALAVGAAREGGPRTQAERIDAIARTIKCPTCRSETVYESRAASSVNIRNEIARQVAAGSTNDEVRRYIADRFGEQLLLVPAKSGVSSLVWILPVVALVLALGGLVVVFRRWAAAPAEVTDADRELVASALAAEQASGGRPAP